MLHGSRESASAFGRERWIALAIGLVALLAYRPVLSGYFLADDVTFLSSLAESQSREALGSSLVKGFWDPPFRGANFYRPLLDLSFGFDLWLWGPASWPWHFTNLALHLANALLLAATIRAFLRDTEARDSWAPSAAAASFALSPLAPESVAWISGRSDELALFAMLASLWLYLRADGRMGAPLAGSLALFACGLATKEPAITLPGWIAALHLAGWRGGLARMARGLLPFALITAAYLFLRLGLFGDAVAIDSNAPAMRLIDQEWFASRLNALRVFVEASPRPSALGRTMGTLFVIVAASGLIGATRSREVRALWLLGLLWLGASLLPLLDYLSIAPTGLGARILYIPAAALSTLLAAPLAWRLPAGRAFRTIWALARLSVVARVALALPLLSNAVAPWARAGAMMSAVVPAIHEKAGDTPAGTQSLLLLPDVVDSAVFARNAQGGLMSPPVQPKPLARKVLVLTSWTAIGHIEDRRRDDPGLERNPVYCWNDDRKKFSRMKLPGEAAVDRPTLLREADRAGCREIALEQ